MRENRDRERCIHIVRQRERERDRIFFRIFVAHAVRNSFCNGIVERDRERDK